MYPMRSLHLLGLPRDVSPATRAAPSLGREQAAEHADGGRLARAVGAEVAEDLARRHLERDVVHRGEGAEAAGQPVDLD